MINNNPELHNKLIKDKIKTLIKQKRDNNTFINLFMEDNSNINKRIIELRNKMK